MDLTFCALLSIIFTAQHRLREAEYGQPDLIPSIIR